MTTYKTVTEYAEYEFVEKHSRFIGYVKPVSNEEDALNFIALIRKKHSDATHNVYAYVIRENNISRYSDDGEPKGTAGLPVLSVMNKEEVRDAACVVTRYFGGTLLGSNGLVRAYTAAAKGALSSAKIAQMKPFIQVNTKCPYNLFDRAERVLNEHNAIKLKTEYTQECELSALILEDELEEVRQELFELSGGSIFLNCGEVIYAPSL